MQTRQTALKPVAQRSADAICAENARKAKQDGLDTYCTGCGMWHPTRGGPSVMNPTGPVNGGVITAHELPT